LYLLNGNDGVEDKEEGVVFKNAMRHVNLTTTTTTTNAANAASRTRDSGTIQAALLQDVIIQQQNGNSWGGRVSQLFVWGGMTRDGSSTTTTTNESSLSFSLSSSSPNCNFTDLNDLYRQQQLDDVGDGNVGIIEVDWDSTDLNDLYRQVRTETAKEALPENWSVEDFSWKAIQRTASDDCLNESLRIVYLEEVNEDDDVLSDVLNLV
jgi:hypothetical protein